MRYFNTPGDARRPPDLAGHKLVMLHGKPAEILLVADVDTTRFTNVSNLGSVFVITGSALKTSWKMALPDPAVPNDYADSSLPLGDECPYGISLVYS